MGTSHKYTFKIIKLPKKMFEKMLDVMFAYKVLIFDVDHNYYNIQYRYLHRYVFNIRFIIGRCTYNTAVDVTTVNI